MNEITKIYDLNTLLTETHTNTLRLSKERSKCPLNASHEQLDNGTLTKALRNIAEGFLLSIMIK